MYAAIDLILDKLERQIHKYKRKINRKNESEEKIYNIAKQQVLQQWVN